MPDMALSVKDAPSGLRVEERRCREGHELRPGVRASTKLEGRFRTTQSHGRPGQGDDLADVQKRDDHDPELGHEGDVAGTRPGRECVQRLMIAIAVDVEQECPEVINGEVAVGPSDATPSR